MAIGFLMIGASIFQDAYAAIDCNSAVLESGAFYVGDKNGILHKVDTTTVIPTTCEVGEMREDVVGPDGVFEKLVICQDIGLDETDTTTPSGEPQLYCLAFGNELHKIDRLETAVGPGGSDVLKSVEVGAGILDDDGNTAINVANALEIDIYGVAYIAALGNQGGKFYNIDLTTAIATLRTDFNLSFGGCTSNEPPVGCDQFYDSSGDLIRDESTTSDMYWTVLCSGLSGGTDDCGDEMGDDDLDRLFRITLNGGSGNPGEKDSITALKVLPVGSVFGAEMVQPTFNICYINVNGILFETDRD